MAFTREDLFNDVCDFLKETRVTPTSTHPTASRIRSKEVGSAETILSMHPWNFALVTSRLQLLEEADDEADEPNAALAGFRYAFSKGDGLYTNWVSHTGRERDRLVSGQSWTDKGGRILSAYSPLYADMVSASYAQEAKYGEWPRLFGKAVASQIADELVAKVVNSRAHSADVSARTKEYIEEAMLHDARQAPAPTRREGSWLRGRGRRRGAGESL